MKLSYAKIHSKYHFLTLGFCIEKNSKTHDNLGRHREAGPGPYARLVNATYYLIKVTFV